MEGRKPGRTMSYGANILSLKNVIEISEVLKNKSIERFVNKPSDEELAEYRDYQVSLVYYLNYLKQVKPDAEPG